MPQPAQIDQIRDEALRKLGRNIVNFQKIEACLKHLLTISNVQGTRATLQKNLEQRKASVRKKSLGKLAGEFHKSAFDNAPVEPPSDMAEIWISTSIGIETDSDTVKQNKRELAELVSERNKLIHQELVQFDHNSLDSCRSLIKRLDEQNVRILKQLANLKSLIDASNALLLDLQSWVESDDYFDHFDNGSSSNK